MALANHPQGMGREEGHRMQALAAPPAEGRLGVERLNRAGRCRTSLSGFARYRERPFQRVRPRWRAAECNDRTH
jgi:hypothetical protein